jgi:hypothetical protein
MRAFFASLPASATPKTAARCCARDWLEALLLEGGERLRDGGVWSLLLLLLLGGRRAAAAAAVASALRPSTKTHTHEPAGQEEQPKPPTTTQHLIVRILWSTWEARTD